MEGRRLWFGLQVAVTAGLLLLLFRNFDWPLFGAMLRQLSWAFIFASLSVVLAGQIVATFRWQAIMDGMGVRVGIDAALRQSFIGQFFSNVMPTGVGGDAAKIYFLGKGAGYLLVGASVFADRLVGFAWLAILGAGLAWFVPAATPVLLLNRNLLTLFAVAFIGAFAVASMTPLDQLLLRFVPDRFRSRVAPVAELAGLVGRGARNPRALVLGAIFAGAYSWAMALVYRHHFAMSGFETIGVAAVALIVISMAIFVNVPISVNGIGLREQLHVLLFTAMGIPKEVSVTISLLLFAHSLVLSLIGCGLWLQLRGSGAGAPS